MKHILLAWVSFTYVIKNLAFFIFFLPGILLSQTSQDTIIFKVETKSGIPFPGVSLDYEFSDAYSAILEGQLVSDSLGVIWFLNPGNQYIEKLLVRFSKNHGPFRGVDYGDLSIGYHQILENDNLCQPISEFLDQEFEFGLSTLTLVYLRGYHLTEYFPQESNDFNFRFENVDGSKLGITSYSKFDSFFQVDSTNIIGAYHKYDFNNNLFETPSDQLPVLNISIENNSFELGDTILLNIKPDSTIDYRAFQVCLKHEDLEYIGDFSNYNEDYLLQLGNILPNYYEPSRERLLFRALSDGTLKEKLSLANCNLSNEYYFGDCYEPGFLQLLFEEASYTNQISKTAELEIYPNPAQNFINICLLSNNEWTAWQLITNKGKKIKEGSFNKENKVQIDDLDIYPKGLYFLRFTNSKGAVKMEKIVIQ